MNFNYLILIYSGRVETNFLISFFTVYNELPSLIFCDAAFQTFLLSFMNVDWELWDLPLLICNLPLFNDLELQEFRSTVGNAMLRGVLFILMAFQTSASLIWAFILLTDSIFRFVITVSVLTLSLILLLFKNLIILFWTSWISCRSWFWH